MAWKKNSTIGLLLLLSASVCLAWPMMREDNRGLRNEWGEARMDDAEQVARSFDLMERLRNSRKLPNDQGRGKRRCKGMVSCPPTDG